MQACPSKWLNNVMASIMHADLLTIEGWVPTSITWLTYAFRPFIGKPTKIVICI